MSSSKLWVLKNHLMFILCRVVWKRSQAVQEAAEVLPGRVVYTIWLSYHSCLNCKYLIAVLIYIMHMLSQSLPTLEERSKNLRKLKLFVACWMRLVVASLSIFCDTQLIQNSKLIALNEWSHWNCSCCVGANNNFILFQQETFNIW